MSLDNSPHSAIGSSPDVSPSNQSPNQRSNRRRQRGQRHNDRSKLVPLNDAAENAANEYSLESEQLINQQAKPNNSPNKNRIVAPNPIISTTNSNNFQSIPTLNEPERRSLGAPHLEIYNYKGEEYELLNFICAPPAPCPPCRDLLPIEEMQLERQRTSQLHRDEQLPDPSLGLWSRLSTTFSNIVHSFERGVDQITNSVTDLANEHIDMAAYDRLRAHFPVFTDEKIVGCYHCKLVTRNGSLDGFLEITNNHIFFIQQGGSSIHVRLAEILSIMRLKLAPAGNMCREHYIPLFESDERTATAIEFFITSGQLLLFNDFKSLRQTPEHLVQECYNVTDHVWRSAADVPNKYWSYADEGTFLQPNSEPVPITAKSRGYTPPPM